MKYIIKWPEPPYTFDRLLSTILNAVPLERELDKIRAEISAVYESLDGYDPDSLGAFVSKIDEIFDKYKTEQEE